ncbi:hypothetical protein RFI_21032 [Reticulomyxa filosa]|uniref:Uncharacterized protein n=1 Tax=Reticulomyxa filosa TaxID=46433 RepID=X6MRN6_RETFI|nr:hypothetical protein RFI_21032 [Reticulomyxa filosa]|eukprot:ETO16321.1 hypothetical protein RFI_21032 [Reticulomyxa filosa]
MLIDHYYVTDKSTWSAVEKWCKDMEDENCVLLIAGNKCLALLFFFKKICQYVHAYFRLSACLTVDLVIDQKKSREISLEEVEGGEGKKKGEHKNNFFFWVGKKKMWKRFARSKNAVAIEGSGQTGQNVGAMFQKVELFFFGYSDKMLKFF